MSSSGHVFHEMFLHINWHCYRDEPFLTPEIKENIFAFIKDYCRKLKDVYFKGIGGTRTHVHLLVQIEPFIDSSEVVGKIKGASTRAINSTANRIILKWQRGYGIVTFAKKNLSAMVAYIQNQEAHHSKGTDRNLLEMTGSD
jgi:putative transposase